MKSEKKGEEFFHKQALFSAAHQTYGDCKYYPCHSFPGGQNHLNCLFCYCPFYPCANKVGTGTWTNGQDGKRVWDCSSCSFIHRDDVSSRVYELFLKDKSARQIKKIIRGEFPR